MLEDGCYHAPRTSGDPRDVIKAGDTIKVKVVEVDLKRRRIALTMKLQAPSGGNRPAAESSAAQPSSPRMAGPGKPAPGQDAPRRDAPSTSKAEAFGNLSRTK